jgi:hypothetical protein
MVEDLRIKENGPYTHRRIVYGFTQLYGNG